MGKLPTSGSILVREQIVDTCREVRRQGRSIVFTNGCFDVLHAGHVTYLAAAAELGDVLIVGVNSDLSVRNLKGPRRPVVDQNDRATILTALRSVDYVTMFDEPTPFELIQMIVPDVLVKGGDYDPNAVDGSRYIVGSDVVRNNGGRVQVITLVEGRSTSDIIAKVLQAYRTES